MLILTPEQVITLGLMARDAFDKVAKDNLFYERYSELYKIIMDSNNICMDK